MDKRQFREHEKAKNPKHPTRIAGNNSKATISMAIEKRLATSHSCWPLQLAIVQKAIIKSQRPPDSTNQKQKATKHLDFVYFILAALRLSDKQENMKPSRAKGIIENRAE